MKQFTWVLIAVISFYNVQAQQEKFIAKEQIKKAIETGNFTDIEEPKNHEETEFYSPVPAKVNPYGKNGAPSDAIILFDGTSTNEWVNIKGQTPCTWKLDTEEKSMTVFNNDKKTNATIVTKRKFGAVQLHLEWRSPDVIENRKGQARGNSGVYLDNRYEIQILDNNHNDTYVNGMVGSVYKQSSPAVNASVETGLWNSYDIIYHPPVFEEGKRMQKGTITVLQNGVLVQDYFLLKGATSYIGWPKQDVHGKGAIKLQDHGSAVSYRNIWVRELE